MGFFEEQNGRLIFRENGETVQVEAWGTDSLRVRSRILSDIEEGNAALLKQLIHQGGLSVVNMGDNRNISHVVPCIHTFSSLSVNSLILPERYLPRCPL